MGATRLSRRVFARESHGRLDAQLAFAEQKVPKEQRTVVKLPLIVVDGPQANGLVSEELAHRYVVALHGDGSGGTDATHLKPIRVVGLPGGT
jgi:hypothetical protein